MRRFLPILLAVPVLAQNLHFGLRAGVPLTAYFETERMGILSGTTEYSAATRRYTLGPSIEYRSAGGWGLEADALFKRQGYVNITQFTATNLTTNRIAYDVKGDSWDVPVLFKYRFARWYAAGGGTLRYVGPVRALGETTTTDPILGTTRTPIDTTDPVELSARRWYAGVTAAAGLELGRGRLRFEPEFRYTRWARNIAQPGLRFTPNQGEFLLGLIF